ncbi:MAG TPA: glycosyltransferase [Candidatus Didemnitutus sp.]|jgi:hypothetical protein
MTPDLTIVIPYFNRATTLHYTVASIDRARRGLEIEVVLVDDGSAIPAATTLADGSTLSGRLAPLPVP